MVGERGRLELAVIVNLEVSLLPHGVDVSFQAFSAGRDLHKHII